MLNKLLTLIGYSQQWHASWCATFDDGWVYGSLVFTAAPRLTINSLRDLQRGIAEAEASEGHEVRPENITIISLTRIGK